MGKKSKNDIYSRINEARKCNSEFNQFVELCEIQIARWKDEMIAENKLPHRIPKTPRKPEKTEVTILLPVIPISPEETELLLDYMREKYLKEKTVGGDYFTLSKCLFKKNYKLSSHYYHYFD